MGKLYVCATPIGNLEDVSIRLLKTLRKVDIIACEDTRQTIKLLTKYKIRKPLVSYHRHSHQKKEDSLIDKLINGQTIALVSDAGMPAISDPGQNLVKKAIEKGIDIEVLPGPSAFAAALVISGLDSSAFIFRGFLSSNKAKRRRELEGLKKETCTVILYEAPHRFLALLKDIEEIMGLDRFIVVARELTKRHEEVKRGKIGSLREYYEKNPVRGEITVLIAGEKEKEIEVDLQEIVQEAEELVKLGVNKNEAFKKKAKEYNIKKSAIYNYYVKNRPK